MKAISEMTNRELKSEAKGLHQQIYGNVICYGTWELCRYDALLAELDKRGYVMTETANFTGERCVCCYDEDVYKDGKCIDCYKAGYKDENDLVNRNK